jgi:GST-like protein
MSENNYQPPKVWEWKQNNGGAFANINRPVSGATHDRELPVGAHPLQLYSLGTPNGQKVTIMLEELLALGVSGAEYDAWLIRIGEGDQFSSGFVEVNPNSKIPALRDHSTTPPTRVFESGSILLYLAEKFGFFLPKDPAGRTETLNWLFWLQGSAPFLGGGFGHFFSYAPVKIEYAIDRFTMEAKRQLDVLDKQLARGRFVAGEEYTIADMAIWPWYGNVVLGNVYNAAEFLDAGSYKNVLRWAQDVATARPSSADASLTAPTARSTSSFMSAMTPATSTPKPKISARRNALAHRRRPPVLAFQPIARHKVAHRGRRTLFEEVHHHISVQAIATGEDPRLPGAELAIAGFFKHAVRVAKHKPAFIVGAKFAACAAVSA